MIDAEERIKTKEQLKSWLKYEYAKYESSRIKDLFLIGENAVLKKHLFLLRTAEYHTNTNHRIRSFIYRFLLLKMQNKYAIHVPLNCCARGFKIMHVGPVLINPNASIGENCSFHINTAVVAGGGNSEAPVLKKGVVLGVGSVVLGNTTIEEYVAVGANAVVNKDVLESNIAVAGVPAKKISSNGTLTWNKHKLDNQK